MDWATLCEKAIAYFEDNRDEYDDCLNEVSSYTDYKYEHSDTVYEPMDSFNDYFGGTRDILELIERLDSDFNTRDEYFYDDGWTIYSTDDPEYDDLLDDDFIEELYDNNYRVDLPEYIEKLFEAYDADEEDDDEDEEEEFDEDEEDKE